MSIEAISAWKQAEIQLNFQVKVTASALDQQEAIVTQLLDSTLESAEAVQSVASGQSLDVVA